MLRQLGSDLGFVPLVIGGCSVMFIFTLLASGGDFMGGGLNFLSPSSRALTVFGMSGAYPVFIQGRWWTILTASWPWMPDGRRRASTSYRRPRAVGALSAVIRRWLRRT